MLNLIELQNVTVCYDPHSRYPVNAIEGIDLKIESGEWVFLVGPSGAGKSSILKLLYAGARARLGNVTIDGTDSTHLPPREIPLLRRKIGVIFQDFQLLPQKTAWENVAFALQVIGAPQAQIVREVPRALQTVGLSHRAQARPHELSGGEQQRIAIARAIVNNPSILLADEPTGNLDPATAWEIAQVLRCIQQESGTTVIIATHDRAVVDALRQRVVRLADGRIVSDENPGVYHPEDDLAADDLATPRVTPDYSLPQPAAVEMMPEHAALNHAMLAAPLAVDAAEWEDAAAEHSPMIETAPLLAADPLPVANGHHAFVVEPRPELRPQPLADPPVESYLEKMRRNNAPIGSEENPIVQFGHPLDAKD